VVQEISVPRAVNAAVVIGLMFESAAREHLHPVAFASGTDTSFWWWYERSTGAALTYKERLFGIPFYTDRMIPDSALILCAGYGKGATLVDTQTAYKIEMEIQVTPPDTVVEVIE
jgi:hypothetical protein